MKEVSLYIHIPFCKKKCWYCDFPSFCGKEHLMEDYIHALGKEIKNNLLDYSIKTIFIGGGTPTYLSLKELKTLGQYISLLNIKEDVEFTVECNPGTLDVEKLKVLKAIGVNRLSIGLQAFQNKHLKSIGRIHNIDEFLTNFHNARSEGFNNINIDIMFGLPNQSLEEWEETLREVAKLNPEHISSYSLIIEEGTPFYQLYKDEKLNTPKEDLERNMYKSTLDILKSYGYHQYEISNFSKAHKECRHNLVYWNLEEYIGVGSGAHSYVENERYRNEVNIEKYIMSMKEKGNAVIENHSNSLKEDMEEFIFMGLRKIEGIREEDFKSRFQLSMEEVYKNPLEKHIKEGLLIRNNGFIYLSPRGIELSNYVMSDFIF